MSAAAARLTTGRGRRLALPGAVVLAVALAWCLYQGSWSWWARSQLQAAQEACAQHDWPTARNHVKAALLGRPNNPDAHRLAARVARRLERFDEAARHLDACQRLHGAETHAIRVERALLQLSKGELASSEQFLRDCVANDDPDTIEILDIISAALLLHYRVAEAQECLDDLLRRRPNHFHALVRRAWTARSSTDYLDAIHHLRQAVALRPDADAPRLMLAELLVATTRAAEAQQHFEELARRQPNNPSVRFGLARCRAESGDAEEALQMFDRLLAEFPNDWQALGERGWVALLLGRSEEAAEYLRRAHALAPHDVTLMARLATCLGKLGKDREAKEFQAQADQHMADIRRAARVGKAIREEKPDDAELRHELACCLLRLGRVPDALHWFQTALDKDPRHRPTHRSLAEFFERGGDSGRAAPHRQMLETLDRER